MLTVKQAYVHDLEEKVRQYDETQVSSSGSITDLKRELARYKDGESHSAAYIADLESRLSKSDESVLSLRATVEKLERECDKRRSQAEALEARLESLKLDGESWRTDLEEREAKVRELEQKMADWEVKMQAANEERERLNELASEVAKAKKELEASPLKSNGATTNGTTTNGANSEVSSLHENESSVESQLVALQQTHTATLADLSSVTVKYRDALREIADLAAQLQEAKVNAPPTPPETGEISPGRRRMQRSRDQEPSSASGRRLFFRNAASSESLHSRYVLAKLIGVFLISRQSDRSRNLYRSRRSYPRPDRAKPLRPVTGQVAPFPIPPAIPVPTSRFLSRLSLCPPLNDPLRG